MCGMNRCAIVFLTISAFLVFAGAAVFFFFGQFADEMLLEFHIYNRTLQIFSQYPVEITPAEWTFWTWSAVFGWQFLWLFYALVMMCRRNGPKVLTPFFFVFNILAFGCTLAWVMLWGEDLVNIALGFIAGTAAFLLVALGIVYHRFNVLRCGMKNFPLGDQIAMELLVLNGLALYASWALYNSFQGTAIVLKYTVEVDDAIVCTIVQAGIAATLLFWFCLDSFVFWRYTLLTITPYVPMIVGFAGTFMKNWDKEKRNAIFNAALMGSCSLMLLVKILHVIWRFLRDKKKSRRHVIAEEEKFEL
ncbi:PREDICTED: uncharacterized protein LOC107337842 [Acropora digitifera]|uniref:uncharacterized protein LOC107337842 n=1 Tax=Acropora digitifera TaxID=70779 RepID=UPI00077A96BE|nr:PREDICTED: uncharacterized protein LOC107337842 [Acropora digitifera]